MAPACVQLQAQLKVNVSVSPPVVRLAVDRVKGHPLGDQSQGEVTSFGDLLRTRKPATGPMLSIAHQQVPYHRFESIFIRLGFCCDLIHEVEVSPIQPSPFRVFGQFDDQALRELIFLGAEDAS